MARPRSVHVDVYSEANEKIGDINDVILDRSGKVAKVILGVGGVLGLGEPRGGRLRSAEAGRPAGNFDNCLNNVRYRRVCGNHLRSRWRPRERPPVPQPPPRQPPQLALVRVGIPNALCLTPPRRN